MQREHAGKRRRRSVWQLANSRRRWGTAGIGLLAALLPEIASAHVRWFVPPEQQLQLPDWSLLARWPTLAVLGLSLALWIVLKGLERLVGTPHFPNPRLLAHMEPHATTVLALQTGISLVWFAYQRALFVPPLTLPPSWLGWLLVALQLVVAFTFITSLFDRAGAALLVLVFLLGFAVFTPVAMLEQLLYVGIAIAIFVLGVTIPPAAVARRLLPLARYERQAVSALRVLTGCSLVVVAFSEKLLNPGLSEAVLQEYPRLNFVRTLFGWTWATDRLFGDLAGVVEATIGLLLISGVLTRVVILAMWVPFNLTVPLLPPIELLGHLPIFGIMYLLLLYGSGVAPETAARRLEPALTGELEASRRRIRGEDDSRSADHGKTA